MPCSDLGATEVCTHKSQNKKTCWDLRAHEVWSNVLKCFTVFFSGRRLAWTGELFVHGMCYHWYPNIQCMDWGFLRMILRFLKGQWYAFSWWSGTRRSLKWVHEHTMVGVDGNPAPPTIEPLKHCKYSGSSYFSHDVFFHVGCSGLKI